VEENATQEADIAFKRTLHGNNAADRACEHWILDLQAVQPSTEGKQNSSKNPKKDVKFGKRVMGCNRTTK
jgi:hypothetical protein